MDDRDRVVRAFPVEERSSRNAAPPLGDEQVELALSVACGLTPEEIAERFGWSIEDVYRRLFRLRIVLEHRAAWEEKESGSETQPRQPRR